MFDKPSMPNQPNTSMPNQPPATGFMPPLSSPSSPSSPSRPAAMPGPMPTTPLPTQEPVKPLNIPQTSAMPQPVAETKESAQPVSSFMPPPPPQKISSIPIQEQTILSEEEQTEMIRRDRLSRIQKIILIGASIFVLLALIGGGVWLYFTINPFSGADIPLLNTNTSKTNKNINQNININANTNISVDSDNDGLSDIEEAAYGTDPNNPDSDGDTYPDGGEVANGYNPLGAGKLAE